MKACFARFFEEFSKTYMAVLLMIVVAPVCWWLWVAYGVQWTKQLACPSDSACQYLGQVGDIFGGVNALFAGLAFGGVLISIHVTRKANIEQGQLDRDEKILEQICKSYQWAYDVLNEKKFLEDGPPRADLLAWLTCARHLLRAKSLKKSLRTELFQTMQAEQEEYWRTKFYTLLDHQDLSFERYYLDYRDSRLGNEYLDYRSVLVVAEFIASNRDHADPIDSVELVQAAPDWTTSNVGRGLKQYVLRIRPGLAEKVPRAHQ